MSFKGENGLMKKKFTALQKDVENQNEEIKGLIEKEKQLKAQIDVFLYIYIFNVIEFTK